MAPMSEKAMAKAEAKAAKKAEETKIVLDHFAKVGIWGQHKWSRFRETSLEHLERQKKLEEGHMCACDCADTIKKSTFYANVAVCCYMFITFMILQLLCAASMGAFAAEIGALQVDHTTDIVARGLNIDSSTFVADSVCTLTSGSAYPTPSKAFVTKNIGGVTITDHLMVTPAAAHNVNSSCSAPEVVTVTVTTTSDNDAVSATAGDGGTPPMSDITITGTFSGSVTSFTTVTTTSTSTATSTLSETEDETTVIITSTSANRGGGTTTFTQVKTARTTLTVDTTTVTVDPVTSHTLSLIKTLGTGTGASASWTLAPSTNGTYTYSVPSVAPTSSIVASDGGVSAFAGRGSGGRGGDVTKRGNSSGFYCVVMAVACALAVVV